MENEPEIWTIGHSTRSLEELVSMLKAFDIQLLADVRSFPGSRKYPHFNKPALEISIPLSGMEYIHLPDLGGRRKATSNSKNIAWHHPAFRNYADYMETDGFQKGIAGLMKLASVKRTAFMCSEAVWWRCHRSMISDYLKIHGWKVMHIMGEGIAKEHPYTGAAVIKDGILHYDIVKE